MAEEHKMSVEQEYLNNAEVRAIVAESKAHPEQAIPRPVRPSEGR